MKDTKRNDDGEAPWESPGVELEIGDTVTGEFLAAITFRI